MRRQSQDLKQNGGVKRGGGKKKKKKIYFKIHLKKKKGWRP